MKTEVMERKEIIPFILGIIFTGVFLYFCMSSFIKDQKAALIQTLSCIMFALPFATVVSICIKGFSKTFVTLTLVMVTVIGVALFVLLSFVLLSFNMGVL